MFGLKLQSNHLVSGELLATRFIGSWKIGLGLRSKFDAAGHASDVAGWYFQTHYFGQKLRRVGRSQWLA
ncbi:MAG: hypothetical protein KDE30_13235, partial [Novosphingobium sp.]|nr:hypothetical protein [Novosphingobium sp.]